MIRKQTYIDCFIQAASTYGSKTAVDDGERTITYAELDDASSRLASVLIDNGIGVGDFVVLLTPRKVSHAVALLAVGKAGGCYVPVNPSFPTERINYILQETTPKVILTEDSMWQALPQLQSVHTGNAAVLALDNLDYGSAAPLPSARSEWEGRAALLYTSGTTGNPKGVLHAFRGLTLVVENNISCGLSSHDAVHAAVGDFMFMPSVLDVLTPLCCGATTHYLSSDYLTDMPRLYRFICEHGITTMFMPTGVGVAMLNSYQLPLQHLAVAGERLSGLTFRLNRDLHIINNYGSTEGANITMRQVLPDETDSPLGKPEPGITYYILDEHLQPVPAGESGEFCYCSDRLALGYYNKPEATQSKFVACPFAPGRTMYRTGDLVRQNANGELVHMGRIDNMVKVNGVRIETGEVENVAVRLNGMIAAVCVARKVSNATLLCIYYEAERPIEEAELRSHLAASLAATMLPTIYVQMEHLPRNLRGKISRSDLPEVAISLDFTPPSSVLEEKITQTVEQVLECETHGVCTNLIALGMSSLQAMRIAATLQTEHGISIAVRTMMQYPTVRLMAENATTGETASCDDTDNTAEFPMLGCQHGIYLDWVRQESSTRYNIPIIITYPLDLYTTDVVLSAVQKVLVAHPSLRIRISTQKAEGLPTLTIGKAMPATNTTHIEEEPTTEYIARFITPFSPSDKCYYRVNAIVSPLATTVIIDIHHFVIDGIGADMLIKEISMALMGEDIPKETYTIRNCSLFESKQITTDFVNGAFAHYDSIMTDATDADFHIANHSGEGRGTASTTVSIRSELMQELCHRHAITHNAFFCLVMAECLYRLTREENLRFLTISNGRQSNPLAVNTVSMFANTVPVAYRASSNAGINEVIQQMHKQLNESYRYDAIPFVTLAKRYGITPRCMFVFQEKNVGHGVEKHVSRPWLSEDSAICPFVAQVWHNLRNSAFTLSIDYDRSIHSEADVQLFAQLFTDIAGNMMDTLFLDADAKLQAVANMTADKVGHVMDISSGKALKYDHSETIVDMVLRHAHNNPDSLAVSAVDGTLTYAELDRQSLAVAHALQCHGVSRGEFVGIMLPRISSFVTAVLGVMRLGAAYVPIDPDYPQERINYMKEDCGAKILIDFAWIDGVLRDNKDNGVTEQEAESLTKTEPSLPAYMIYTSGSTGKPKGTVITHRALRAFVAWNIDAFSITPESRNAHYCSFSFDASMNDLMCPLAAGASIYIMPAEIRQDINGMYRYLLDNAINGVSIPTALTDAMLTQYHDLPVDYVLVGGERMTAIHEGTKVSIVNCYGPTEFTVCATYYTIDSHTDANNIPIGRPVPNTSACVCDPRGNLLPLGFEGELLLSGHQISDGYWHQPDKTAESFVDDCGSRFAYGGKRYRTGDIVRYNADGNIEFCGRIDNQVKLRGYRIELGEIETAACALPQLKHAVCRIRQVGGSDKLCLWYSTTDGQHDTLQTILADHLGKTLPEYMVPDHLIYVEEFPKTPTGKVDDSQLTVTTNTVSDYIPPVTADERTLCRIAAETLHVDRVSLTADLIHQLGMSSLQVLQFAAQASANGMNVKVGDVYKAKTISALLHIDRHKPYFIIGSLDDGKPLIIIIQGIFLITGEENELIRHLRERYTILVFETLDDTFAEVDDISFEALMEMYISIIDEVLRGRHISFMFGYCFGGEIALHLSHAMSMAKGNGPAVIAFDPIYDRSNIPSLLQPAIASHQRIAPALAAQYPQYHYHDNFIILFSGEKTTRNLSDPLSPEAIEASHQMMTGSQQEWRTNLPDIPKYTLPGDHYCMFRPDILSIVSDIVKKHRL